MSTSRATRIKQSVVSRKKIAKKGTKLDGWELGN